jgi:ParB family chromosome partitioning protein
MNEAQAISLMQQTGKNIEEISARLGKSKQFVYIRLKLLNLIEAFQEMFFADVLTIQQAVEIANISPEGQHEFFEQHCSKWKKQKDFRISNLEYYLRQYKYDLRNAPFNTKDKKLIPEVGACSTCSFNSATLKSLFPEYAKQAICTNTACYQNKCSAHLKIGFVLALKEHQPAALLFNGEPLPLIESILSGIDEALKLPRHNCNEVTILHTPVIPDKEDYTNEYSDDEPEFDEEGYNDAMQEYENELAEYQINLGSGKFQKALMGRNDEFIPVLFSPEPPPRYNHNHTGKSVTAKAVQEAVKAGTATAELLQEAIQGILQREQRAKQIDRDKIQSNIHKQFGEKIQDISYSEGLTDADLAAARLLIYQSLDYNTRRIVQETLFPESQNEQADAHDNFYKKLQFLTDQQYSYLIRMAMACKSDSKFPYNETGFVLYKVAEASGIEVKAIEQEGEERAIARNERMHKRIEELMKKKEKLKMTV